MTEEAQIQKRIEQIRQKLLDLSTSNKMLSYKHPTASCLRIVDELPSEIFKYIMDGTALHFEPVPLPRPTEIERWNRGRSHLQGTHAATILSEPKSAEWASHIGIDPSFDLAVQSDDFELEQKHTDELLQTLHYPDELQSRLRRLRSAARSAIEETGSNMLFLSFGFLEWTEQTGTKSFQAPLVLVPVLLNKTTQKGAEKITVSWNGDEVQPNLSLTKKLNEFGINLPAVDEYPTIERFFHEISLRILAKTEWRVRRYITLGLFDFGKIVLYDDLDPAKWPQNASLTLRPLVRRILAGKDGENNLSSESAPIDSRHHDLELPLIDRADSSQCIALSDVLSGKNLVIEGPPGTGKSQTITNLIACALHAGKTILFVAEKLEALDVVKRRLRELGLGDFCLELHSAKTKKTSVLEGIRDRLQAETNFTNTKSSTAPALLAKKREQLSKYLEIIAGNAGNMQISVQQALIRAGSFRRKIGDAARHINLRELTVKNCKEVTPLNYHDAMSRIEGLQQSFLKLGQANPVTHVWRGVSSSVVLQSDSTRLALLAANWGRAAEKMIPFSKTSWAEIGRHDGSHLISTLNKLAGAHDSVNRCERAIEYIEEIFQARKNRDISTLEGLLKLKHVLDTVDFSQVDFDDVIFEGGSSVSIDSAISLTDVLVANEASVRNVFTQNAFELSPNTFEDLSYIFERSNFFSVFYRQYRAACAEWKRFARPQYAGAKREQRANSLAAMAKFLHAQKQVFEDTSLTPLRALISARATSTLTRLKKATELISEISSAVLISPADLKRVYNNTTLEDLRKTLREIDASEIHEVANLLSDGAGETFWECVISSGDFKNYRAVLDRDLSHIKWPSLIANAEAYVVAYEILEKEQERFAAASGVDFSQWHKGGLESDCEYIALRAFQASESPETLGAWLEFDRSLSLIKGSIEEPFVNEVLSGALNIASLKDYFSFALYDGIARECFRDHPQLRHFSATQLDQLRAEYRNIDAEVMEARRVETAEKLFKRKPVNGIQNGLASQLTEMALLRHEMGKKKGHRPIRDLMRRAGRSIQALKPCFMMGPISAAQYIQPGALSFDLVVIDEASQMRPEDSLGALARGGQAVIVGDPKQLPPTSFFDRATSISDNEDDREVTIAEDSQSILDLSTNIFTSQMLKFHYRSRHESLIAFSNARFYRNELIVFPSPRGQSDTLGIGWNFIADGVADKGLNLQEARAIAKFVAQFVKEHRGRSIGVVAMNVKQADRIQDEIQALRDRDRELNERLSTLEDTPGGEDFFVKNLERVQGDQRDVIVISMTYGPVAPGGRTPQNFGPINHDTGWRRLNVLFTRAKERMEIFSSMRSSDIIPKDASDSGPDALRSFLQYAETGTIGSKTERTSIQGNEFEDAIQAGLESLNYKCVPQLGVGSYRIDLAIEDPDRPHSFIAGIECDGATYHSTKSARDRDRIRQEILEGLGWTILRIWSTDWFNDPNAELARIDVALKNILKKRLAAPKAPFGSAPEKSFKRSHESNLIEVQAKERGLKSDSCARSSAPLYISLEEAREKLISIREGKIKRLFPHSDPAAGVLRKAMIDELLRKKPTELEEFHEKISASLREKTEGAQLREVAEEVFDILSRLRD